MFDIGKFLGEALPAAIFFVPIINGLMTVIGKTWPVLKGRYQFITVLIIGLFLGTPLFWAMTAPVTPGDWVAVIMFGIVCGLTASGLYNTQKAAAEKGTTQAIETAVVEQIEDQLNDQSPV